MAARIHERTALDEIQRRLGVEFADVSLLNTALTHRSYINEHSVEKNSPESYERLEFLGDAVLNVSVASRLFDAMPDADEGTLTLGRSHVVCRDSLASVSRDIGLGEWIVFGRGESSAHIRDSVLEDVYESVLGAVYVDQGALAAEHFITQTLGDAIRDVVVNGVEKNPKSKFQEVVQSYGLPTPKYATRQMSTDGEFPMTFEADVYIAEFRVATALSNGKTRAEMVAAQEGLLIFSKGVPVALKGRTRPVSKASVGFSRTPYSRRKLPLSSEPVASKTTATRNPFKRLWVKVSGAVQPARIAGTR